MSLSKFTFEIQDGQLATMNIFWKNGITLLFVCFRCMFILINKKYGWFTHLKIDGFINNY